MRFHPSRQWSPAHRDRTRREVLSLIPPGYMKVATRVIPQEIFPLPLSRGDGTRTFSIGYFLFKSVFLAVQYELLKINLVSGCTNTQIEYIPKAVPTGKLSRFMHPMINTKILAQDFLFSSPNPPINPGAATTSRISETRMPTPAVIPIACASPDNSPPPTIAIKAIAAPIRTIPLEAICNTARMVTCFCILDYLQD